MRYVIRAPEPPPRPLEDDERDDDERDEFGELLPDLDEESVDEDENEDDNVGAPDAFDLDPPLEDATFDDQTAPDLRFGHDSVLPEEDGDEAGDASGFATEPRTGQTEPDDAFPADSEEREGIDDFVNTLDLPGLDADEDPSEGDAVRFGTFLAAAEIAWPSARRTWRVTALATERTSVLAHAAGTIVAGSTDLLWLDPGRTTPVRIALDGMRIVSLALIGEGNDTAVAVTSTGRVLRRARLASDCERLGELTRVGNAALDVQGVELCALGAREPRALLMRSANGNVERSDDGGVGFAPLEPRIRAVTLATSAAPVVALGDAERELLVSHDRARTFEHRRLDGAAGTVARGDAPLVAVSEQTLLLVDAEIGLVVSADAGRSFREVPGCVGATACAAGSFGGRPCAWIALYSEAADVTRVLMIDVVRAEAEVIATLAGSGDDEQLGPSARLERLVWDGTRLFAAGEPGFLLVEPPSLEAHH
jgi:hypothetical protein